MSGAFAEVLQSFIQVVEGTVTGVAVNPRHGIGKVPSPSIRLLGGLGVEGDAHCGALVQHRWLRKKDPTLPNRTQVHLLQEELFDYLKEASIVVGSGDLGENVTTQGVDLLGLPLGTLLRIGKEVAVEVTGLREPCSQLNRVHPGLLRLLRIRQAGEIIRKAGVMAVVVQGGEVMAGDAITIVMPRQPWLALGPV